MRRMALALTCCIAAAAAAQQKTDTTGTAKAPDSPLVRAAKAAGGLRKMPKKVITNSDVKTSKGKLVVLPGKAAPAAKAAAPEIVPAGPIERHDALLRQEDAATRRIKASEKKVAELEKEARDLEEAYYAANDPNYRDTVIAPRFHQTKRQLDDARKELADARDALEKLKPKS